MRWPGSKSLARHKTHWTENASHLITQEETKNGKIKGSFRTTEENIDVAEMAKKFGGGGHKLASGFEIKGRVVETEEGWEII